MAKAPVVKIDDVLIPSTEEEAKTAFALKLSEPVEVMPRLSYRVDKTLVKEGIMSTLGALEEVEDLPTRKEMSILQKLTSRYDSSWVLKEHLAQEIIGRNR